MDGGHFGWSSSVHSWLWTFLSPLFWIHLTKDKNKRSLKNTIYISIQSLHSLQALSLPSWQRRNEGGPLLSLAWPIVNLFRLIVLEVSLLPLPFPRVGYPAIKWAPSPLSYHPLILPQPFCNLNLDLWMRYIGLEIVQTHNSAEVHMFSRHYLSWNIFSVMLMYDVWYDLYCIVCMRPLFCDRARIRRIGSPLHRVLLVMLSSEGTIQEWNKLKYTGIQCAMIWS